MADVIVVGFDLERTGGDPTKHAVCQIGAWAARSSDGVHHSSFSATIGVPDGPLWEKACLDEFWENPAVPGHARLAALRRKVLDSKVTEGDAARGFADWVASLPVERVLFASDSVADDALWLSLALARAGLPPLTMLTGGHRCVLDVGSFLVGASRLDLAESLRGATDKAFAALGVPRPERDKNMMHDAVEDAKDACETLLVAIRAATSELESPKAGSKRVPAAKKARCDG